MIYLKTLNMHNAVIRIASVFNENHNQYYYYYHLFLEKCLYI